MFINFVCYKNKTIMDKREIIQNLLHKKMEARATLEAFRILDARKYQKDLDKLLDRINEIDRILEELQKK